MRIGRGVAFKKEDGTFALACVKELKDGALIAVEPNGTEVELVKGTAHRINNEKLEMMLREATGIPLDTPSYYHSPEPESGDEEEDEPYDPELDDEEGED